MILIIMLLLNALIAAVMIIAPIMIITETVLKNAVSILNRVTFSSGNMLSLYSQISQCHRVFIRVTRVRSERLI